MWRLRWWGYRIDLNRIGATPYLLAANGVDHELMRLFLRNGADPLLTNDHGMRRTTLTIALGFAKDGEPLFLGSERHFEVAGYLYTEMKKRGLSLKHEHAASLTLIQQMAGEPASSEDSTVR